MLWPGKRADKPPENRLEAVLDVMGLEFLNARLFSNDELQLRNQVDNELAVLAQRLPERAAPSAHLDFAPGEDLVDQGSESLRQSRVGDVALVPIELAGCKETARRDERLCNSFTTEDSPIPE
jgi:hypothetical protein